MSENMPTNAISQFNIVMPVAKRSLPMLPTVMENIKAHIPAKEIVAIGKASLRDSILALGVTFCDEKSFISEHMLFSTAIMKELLDEIEADDTLKGDRFFEKIICAIDEKYLSGSGFSEFETYGNYVETKYQGVYAYRELKSFRRGDELIASDLDPAAKQYVFQTYDTITFENRDGLF